MPEPTFIMELDPPCCPKIIVDLRLEIAIIPLFGGGLGLYVAGSHYPNSEFWAMSDPVLHDLQTALCITTWMSD
jgi:hypothetical protein